MRTWSALLCAVVVLAGAGCSHPASPISSVGTTAPSSPAPIDAAGQPIVRPSCAEPGDGRYLHATGSTGLTPVLLLGTGPRGVVVGAQANGDICQLLPYGRVLAGKGYHVAVFDWTQPYAEAMATAAQALLADGAAKVVLGGFSRGALVGLGIAPTLGPQVVGVFSVSGGPSAVEGFPTVASLSAYRGPILLVSSVDDAVFPSGTSAAIAAAHAGAETVLLVPGSAHALALLSDPEGGRVQAAIDRFLAQALP